MFPSMVGLMEELRKADYKIAIGTGNNVKTVSDIKGIGSDPKSSEANNQFKDKLTKIKNLNKEVNNDVYNLSLIISQIADKINHNLKIYNERFKASKLITNSITDFALDQLNNIST